MFHKIKGFFSKAWVQWGITLAAIGGTLAYIFKVNDFSRPPIPKADKPQDFSALSKLDSSKPVGVFLFNVHHGNFTDYGVNASRNNYAEKMREHYGDNMIIVDNPTQEHLNQFAQEFNAKFADEKPEVHFVANHHQGTYDDHKLSEFFASIDATSKRALILSCGPDSTAYDQSGCDYVMIPSPDHQGLGVEPSLEISPAYKEAISWLANNKTPQGAKEKFNERSAYNIFQEVQHHGGTILNTIIDGPCSKTYKSPVIVVPPQNTPPKPKIFENSGPGPLG